MINMIFNIAIILLLTALTVLMYVSLSMGVIYLIGYIIRRIGKRG